MPLRITFVLPHLADVPVGGYIVVYRYARELRERGHHIEVVHPRRLDSPTSLVDQMQARIWPMRVAGWRGRRAPSWLDPRDRPPFRTIGALRWVKNADVIIATSWETAAPVVALPPAKGRKFALIQHYEDWSAPDLQTLDESWRQPLHLLVIAKWLRDKALALHVPEVTYCPNGVEADNFFVERPIEGREKAVAFLASDVPFKRLDVALAAARAIQEGCPDVRQTAFGTGPRPAELPDFVRYLRNPSRRELRELLNRSAVFLHTSDAEGWPLPPAEAMLCGAALVATANPGVAEYAVDGVNALLAPLGDVRGLTERALRLLLDPDLRQQLASRGVHDVGQLTWARATDRLVAAVSAPRS